MSAIDNLQHNINIINKNIHDIDNININEIQITELSKFYDDLTKLNIINEQVNDISCLLSNLLNKRVSKYNYQMNVYRKLLNNAENNLNENIEVMKKNLADNDKTFKQIKGKLGINAKIVYDIKSVKETPIYYVASLDQFAININGILYRGNVGNILENELSNNKIQNCKFQNKCIKKSDCHFYHDPIIFNGSRDVKNFHYTSWNYGKGKYNRRYGGLSTIEADLYNISKEEKNQSKDQLIHDLLLTQILNS